MVIEKKPMSESVKRPVNIGLSPVASQSLLSGENKARSAKSPLRPSQNPYKHWRFRRSEISSFKSAPKISELKLSAEFPLETRDRPALEIAGIQSFPWPILISAENRNGSGKSPFACARKALQTLMFQRVLIELCLFLKTDSKSEKPCLEHAKTPINIDVSEGRKYDI